MLDRHEFPPSVILFFYVEHDRDDSERWNGWWENTNLGSVRRLSVIYKVLLSFVLRKP